MSLILNRGALLAVFAAAGLISYVSGDDPPARPCCSTQAESAEANDTEGSGTQATLETDAEADTGTAEVAALNDICQHYVAMHMGSYCVYYASRADNPCQPVSYNSTDCALPFQQCITSPPGCDPPEAIRVKDGETTRLDDPGRSGYSGAKQRKDKAHHHFLHSPALVVKITDDFPIKFANQNPEVLDPEFLYARIFELEVRLKHAGNNTKETIYCGIEIEPDNQAAPVDNGRISKSADSRWAYEFDYISDGGSTPNVVIVLHRDSPPHTGTAP